jgi:hypothetical protein
MPALVASYRKHVVETALKRFYSNMNQAIKLSEVDHGEAKTWTWASPTYSHPALEAWFDEYFQPYLKTTGLQQIQYTQANGTVRNAIKVLFADGSIDIISYNGSDHAYCIKDSGWETRTPTYGKDCFLFGFYPYYSTNDLRRPHFVNKGLEPYISTGWDGTEEGFKADSGMFANIIQVNGWTIPDDYPIKF